MYNMYIYTLLSPTDIMRIAFDSKSRHTYAGQTDIRMQGKSLGAHTHSTSFSEISTIGMRR
jgi:hypothetical protein